MSFIADLHIHSRFSRATSRDLNFEELRRWARLKGIGVIGTGDVTHPGWLDEIRGKLSPDGDSGLFRLREEPAQDMVPAGIDTAQPVRFMLTGEISSIYSYGGKTRKVHNVVCLPDLDAAQRFAARLERIGNIRSDGRPILGLDSRNLLEILLEVSPHAVLIPAHIWTPWFSVLGSKSGFDAIEECYRDLTDHIFALETGLSSDPLMNRMVSSLDRFSLVSNSDAHSAGNLGREANVFSCAMTYAGIMQALRSGRGFDGTLEFFPEEGKYHLDGHRKCDVRLEPDESSRLNGICPVCNGKLTLGVLYRVNELADRQHNQIPPDQIKYRSVLSLDGILGEILGVGAGSKRVRQQYMTLLSVLGPELRILLETELSEIEHAGTPLLSEAIRRVRGGRISAQAGYDGEYGVIRVFEPGEVQRIAGQTTLFADKPKRVRTRETKTPVLSVRESRPPVAAQSVPGDLVLNEAQLQAVEHSTGPLLVIAGPGTGKTRTLVERILHLVTKRDVDPGSILAVTFSNRAAREMSERIETVLLRRAIPGRPETTTFHRLGLRIISENAGRLGFPPSPVVLSDQEAQSLWKRLRHVGDPDLEELEGRVITTIEQSMDRAPSIEELGEALGPGYSRYSAYKRVHGLLDYTDLLVLPACLLSHAPSLVIGFRGRWPFVFVDEFQDINAPQYRLVRLLIAQEGNLFAIGDPDQAIYAFRGSDVRFFSRCRSDFAGARTVSLTRSYRSTDTILKAGAGVLSSIRSDGNELHSGIGGPARVDVAVLPTDKAEAENVVTTIETLIGGSSHFAVDSGRSGTGEAGDISFRDVAVLYRTHTVGDAVEEALGRSGIPVQRPRATSVLDNKDVAAVLACLRSCANPDNGFFGESLLRLGPEGFAPTACRRLAAEIAEIYRGGEPLIKWLRTRHVGSPESTALDRLAERCSVIAAAADNGDIGSALDRALDVMGRSVDIRQTPPWPRLFANARECANLPEFLARTALDNDSDHYDPRAEGVTLMTLHASKGLEWKTVFIIGCEDGLIPLRGRGRDGDPEEERRLFYVGMTRARHLLVLSYAQARSRYGTKNRMQPSPFLSDIPEILVRSLRPSLGRKARSRPDGIQVGLFDPS